MKKIPAHLKKNPRYQGVITLQKIKKGSYSNLLLAQVIEKSQFKTEDSHLFTELVYGTLMHELTLEYQLSPFLKKPEKLPPNIYMLLKTAFYQLFFLDRIPDHAVLNESVNLAKEMENAPMGKLVNGVLRQALRKGLLGYEQLTGADRLEKEFSFPKPLTEFLTPQLGFDNVFKLAKSILEKSKISLRVETHKISREKAQMLLEQEGIETEFSKVSPQGLVGKKGFVPSSRLFQDGLMTIQDESSMLVAPILASGLLDNGDVLDACAAPGGKTTHLASLISGHVTALDLHEHKVNLIKENAARLELSDKITALSGDARKLKEMFPQKLFSGILVDAPCSGLGLMRRKPDIKYQKNLQDFLKLPEIQLEILESAAKVLKVGGIIVYSTCTITKTENEDVVEKFLQKHPEFVLEKIVLDETSIVNNPNLTLTILPQDYLTDGFFISRLRKTR